MRMNSRKWLGYLVGQRIGIQLCKLQRNEQLSCFFEFAARPNPAAFCTSAFLNRRRQSTLTSHSCQSSCAQAYWDWHCHLTGLLFRIGKIFPNYPEEKRTISQHKLGRALLHAHCQSIYMRTELGTIAQNGVKPLLHSALLFSTWHCVLNQNEAIGMVSFVVGIRWCRKGSHFVIPAEYVRLL